MKPVPLLLLLAAVLLASRGRPAAGRPRATRSFDPQLDERLLSAARDGAVSYLLGDALLRVTQRTGSGPMVRSASSARSPFARDGELEVAGVAPAAPQLMDGRALFHLARGHASLETELRDTSEAEEERDWSDRVGELVSKRNDDPPLSIDLTFHLLRHMMEMASLESQREQAHFNQKFLDEAGK